MIAIKESVQESIINNAPKLHEDFPVGSVAHQGDLIIVRIAKLPKSAKSRAGRQLATGNTQGSRHVLERGDVFDADTKEISTAIFNATKKAGVACRVDAEFIGPVFVSPENPTATDLMHPEHGPQGFPSGSVCAVVYQRNLDAEDRARRVQD